MAYKIDQAGSYDFLAIHVYILKTRGLHFIKISFRSCVRA